MRDFDWKIIATLNKTQNITRTADLLFVTQPTLTKRIHIIEDELGVTLVVRSRKGSVLTPEGKQIAAHAEAIVAEIEAAKHELAESNKGTKGVLRIGVPYSYNRYVLPELLHMYSEIYPSIEADVVSSISDDLIKEVEDGNLDVCFAHFNAEDSYLERIPVGEDQMYAVYSKPFELTDLPKLPYIEYSKNPATYSAIKRWWDEYYDTPRKTKYKVNNGDICMTMIHKGLGYGLFSDPKYFIYDSTIYSKPLIFKDGTKFTRKTWLFYKKDKLKSSLVKNFVNFVKKTDINKLSSE